MQERNEPADYREMSIAAFLNHEWTQKRLDHEWTQIRTNDWEGETFAIFKSWIEQEAQRKQRRKHASRITANAYSRFHRLFALPREAQAFVLIRVNSW
jgi:hypothetical protein